MLNFLFLVCSCTIGRPLWSLGHSSNQNFKDLEDDEIVHVGMTHAYLNGGASEFLLDTFKVYDELEGFEGYLGGSVRKEIWGDQVWTLSVWRTESDLKSFSSSDLHRNAIKSSGRYISKIRSTTLRMKRKDVPKTWHEARSHLEQLSFKQY